MRYALLISQDEKVAVDDDERVARFAAFSAWIDQMQARGVLADRGLRLQPTTTSTTVQVRNGDLVIADGPFAETKEQIVGFFVVDCRDLDEAIEVASQLPGARWGTVEVRPVWEI
jgi:hypothetical protein